VFRGKFIQKEGFVLGNEVTSLSTAAAAPITLGRRKKAIPTSYRRVVFWSTYLLLLAAVHAIGLPYYTASIGERLRSPLHDWFKPSGYVGQTAGLVTFFLFVFMWLYPLRKRLPWLSRLGSMAGWLDVHIVAGLMLPLIGAVHAAWRFQGVIGLGYAAMLTVCASGVVGRYLYTYIPRGRSGLELTLAEVHQRRASLVQRIANATGFDPAAVALALEAAVPVREVKGIFGALVALVADDFSRWRGIRQLRNAWRDAAGTELDRETLRESMRVARREIALTQQLNMLQTTQRVFRFWHVAHLPFAITAFLAVTIHVVVVVALGVTWVL